MIELQFPDSLCSASCFARHWDMINSRCVSIIVRDPEILGGEPVFAGTRVPLQALLDYLEGGRHTLDDFLDDFPTVSREMAISALEQGKQLVLSQL